jgi:DNA-directed RNA polymerase specialized sigma24 family protein
MTVTPTVPLSLPVGAIRVRRHPITPTCTATAHGTYHAAHKAGCACPDAVEALRVYAKRLKHGTLPDSRPVDGTGTRRRLQALAVLGYSPRVLADYLGCSKQAVQQLTVSTRLVHPATVARIAALYGPLSGLPPQFNRDISAERRPYIDQTAATARARGWLPPLAWEDVDIDDPHAVPDTTGVLTGRPVCAVDGVLELVVDGATVDRIRAAWDALPTADRPAVVAALSQEGPHGPAMIAAELAALFQVTPRSVMRHRQRARAAAAAAVPPIDEDELTFLRDVHHMTLDEIAAKLDRPRADVVRANLRARARTTHTRYSDDVMVAALRRVLAGEQQKRVAADTGMSRSHLCNLLAGRDRPDLIERARAEHTEHAARVDLDAVAQGRVA